MKKLVLGFVGVFAVSMLAGSAFAGMLSRSAVSSAASTNGATAPSQAAANDAAAAAVRDQHERMVQEQLQERERIAEEQRRQAEERRVAEELQRQAEQQQQREQLRDKVRTTSGKIIGSYSTNLGSHNDANRVTNIKLSLGSINKMVLLPGEAFSFHGAIGDSTNGKLGYKPATVIVGDQYATDYGGGICQVSSTLYNAVLRAKLHVTERHTHSLPVDYVPKGQDATVSFPDLDFKFINSSNDPVRIDASLQGDKVICTIVSVQAIQ